MAKNNVDGVYDSDPKLNKNAKFLKTLTFKEVIDRNLAVMDQTSITMLMGQNITIRVFNMENAENFMKVIHGEDIGTTIKE